MGDTPKYSYSTDRENYHGTFDSVEAAQDEAAGEADLGQHFWVGEQVDPPQPEIFWHPSEWLEQVSCQDEYSMDCAEGWDRSTKEQRAELEAEVQRVMAKWLDRHNLRPNFWLIEKSREFYVAGEVDGVYEIEAV
jgi:hypothetical protein